jgi:hypothetical protein
VVVPAMRKGLFGFEHNDSFLKLALTEQEKNDLVEYLKSL